MKEYISNLKNKLINFFDVGQVVGESIGEEKDFFEMVREAHREWQIALNNFNFSSDPDFVDYSIYNIEAKEKQYIYLLKRARKEKIVLNLKISENDFEKSSDNH